MCFCFHNNLCRDREGERVSECKLYVLSMGLDCLSGSQTDKELENYVKCAFESLLWLCIFTVVVAVASLYNGMHKHLLQTENLD